MFVIFAWREPFDSISSRMKRAANLRLIPICFPFISFSTACSSSFWSTLKMHNIFGSTDECVTELFTESDYPINGRREDGNVTECNIRSIGEGAEWVIEGGLNGVGQCLWIINRASLSPRLPPSCWSSNCNVSFIVNKTNSSHPTHLIPIQCKTKRQERMSRRWWCGWFLIIVFNPCTTQLFASLDQRHHKGNAKVELSFKHRTFCYITLTLSPIYIQSSFTAICLGVSIHCIFGQRELVALHSCRQWIINLPRLLSA